MSPVFPRRDRGTVLLVSLCFVAVMGIVLGSYLALTTRAMQLSNRGFQAELSKQLAEAGLDEALRAFNKNNWSDWTSGTAPNQTAVDWNTTTYSSSKRAVATMTFPSTKFGQGATATVKLRIDNSDAHVLGSGWSTGKSYRIYDVVGYNGDWYTCLATHTSSSSNEPPNLGYWAEAPIPWRWGSDVTYTGSRYQLVNYGGVWYRYISTSASTSTTELSDPRYWRSIPAGLPLAKAWTSGTVYYQNAVVTNGGNTYIAITNPSHTSGATFAADLASRWVLLSHGVSWNTSTIYALGNLVSYGGAWYYCSTAHTSTASFDSSKWTLTKPLSLTWATSTGYARGSIVFNNGFWYYCTTAHVSGTFSTDLTAVRWSRMDSPAANTWISGSNYYVGDHVYYSSAWYRCITADPNSTTVPSSNARWTTANTYGLPNPYISWMYRTAGTYDFNDAVFYSASGTGTWYRRNVASGTTNQAPTNTSYWENALTVSWDWASGDAYNIGDVVNLGGDFYRCIRAHSNATPPNSTYWSTEPLFSTYWDGGKNYNQYDTVRYRGRWYLSLQNSNFDHRPGTDATYWAVAAHSVSPWNATTTYHVDDFVSSGSNWYRSKVDHTNQSPPNSTYWDPVAGAGTSYVWNATTAYAAGVYRSYGGVWYKCLVTNTGESPNNPNYWTPSWAQSSGVTTGTPVVYAEATVTLGDGTTSRTQLRAIIDPATVFPNAAGSATTLSIAGGTGTVDSYDSELATYDAASSGYAAVLAAGSESAGGTSTLLTIGDNTTLKGYAVAASSTTTPFAPRASFGSSATVKGFSSPVSPNTDLAQVSRTPYVPKFDINPLIDQTVLPATLPTNLYLGTPGSPVPSYYYDISPSIATSVHINGPVIWYVNGNLRVNTSDTVFINSTGSLTVYITNSTTGRLRVEDASNGIINRTLDPKKLAIIGDTPSTGTQYYSDTTNPFYGVLYLPYTTATLGLTIANGVEIYGALSANEITFSGAAKIHYDTSLRYASFIGVDQPYTVTEWRELPTTEAATLP